MKKIFCLILFCSILTFTIWAKKREKTAAEIPDSYEQEVTAIQVDNSKIKKSEGSDPYAEKKLKPKNERTVGQKLLGLGKFQKIDNFSVFTKSPVGKLHLKKEASLIYRDSTDIAGFFCYYDSSAYAVQFAQQARNALIFAVNQYFEEFDAKKLDKNANYKKTRALYGTTEAYEEYGLSIATLSHKARPQITFGYEFVDGNPYFVIYAKKTKDLSYVKRTGDDINWENTIPQTYYFTKAQAKTLATFLSDQNVDKLYSETTYTEVGEGDFDEYKE